MSAYTDGEYTYAFRANLGPVPSVSFWVEGSFLLGVVMDRMGRWMRGVFGIWVAILNEKAWREGNEAGQ